MKRTKEPNILFFNIIHVMKQFSIVSLKIILLTFKKWQ